MPTLLRRETLSRIHDSWPLRCSSTAPRSNEEASAETFVSDWGSYRESTVGVAMSENDFSCSGPHAQAHPLRSSSLNGWLMSAILEENFPSWFMRPKNLWRSDTDWGGSILVMATVFSGSVQMPSLLMMWPRNLIDDLWNSHMAGLIVASAASKRCKTADRQVSCSYRVAPNISISSIRHSTPSIPSSIQFIRCWNNSGARGFPNGSLFKWYRSKGVMNVVNCGANGIRQNLLLTSSLLKMVASDSTARVSSTFGIGCGSWNTL